MNAIQGTGENDGIPMAQDDVSGVSTSVDRAIDHIRDRSKGPPLPSASSVTINFHPDAVHDGGMMIASLARDGIYRSQFETGISNGALVERRDAGRWLWESRIFGGAYDANDPSARPKYGALNHRHLAVGGSPRFGSAHLRLEPAVLSRTTFCHPDSHLDPEDFGTADRMGHLTPQEDAPPLADPLDHYVEAHVHGPLRIAEDVAAVVLDPSYRSTSVEEAAHLLDCAVEWHAGFRMEAARIENCIAYRGQTVADLIGSLVVGETLTVACLGKARRTRRADPQVLKHAWHCLARFGSPVAL